MKINHEKEKKQNKLMIIGIFKGTIISLLIIIISNSLNKTSNIFLEIP